ncbi:hypothetical protein GCM10027065_07790 [Rhodanobacter koreensis]
MLDHPLRDQCEARLVGRPRVAQTDTEAKQQQREQAEQEQFLASAVQPQRAGMGQEGARFHVSAVSVSGKQWQSMWSSIARWLETRRECRNVDRVP